MDTPLVLTAQLTVSTDQFKIHQFSAQSKQVVCMLTIQGFIVGCNQIYLLKSVQVLVPILIVLYFPPH